jgi:hypothetical protein
MEDLETLHPGALVRELPDAVQSQVNDLFASHVMAVLVVVRRALLAVDDLPGWCLNNEVGRRTDFVTFEHSVNGPSPRPRSLVFECGIDLAYKIELQMSLIAVRIGDPRIVA